MKHLELFLKNLTLLKQSEMKLARTVRDATLCCRLALSIHMSMRAREAWLRLPCWLSTRGQMSGYYGRHLDAVSCTEL